MSNQAYIKAIACYLPEKIEFNNPTSRLTKKTGIYERHIANVDECASDMAVRAAENLFSQTDTSRDNIDFIVLCTQSPDYFLPTTACLLQHRLGLSKKCGAFDFNLGCSGYIYGLSIAKGLIETGQAGNVMLLTAETYSKFIHPEDSTVRPLFGDGATATLISTVSTAQSGLHSFVFGTDGGGGEHLIVPAGAARNPVFRTPQINQVDEAGNQRTNYHLFMNGGAISNFALEVVPDTVERILQKSQLTKKDIDLYIFHQANTFMLKFLQEKCGLEDSVYWNDPKSCGNTVSSSIPLAIDQFLHSKRELPTLKRVMLIGFGVGLSWSGCIADLSAMASSRNF